ncbi:MAG: sigma-70 family RNA polymerase sigma factor [Solirubrobacteraceae bacterium]|nr:sigma-70 family RNA polymerase sigma factor [Solirubrobacteraceae bacterium]
MTTASVPNPIESRRLREDELLRRYCHHRDRGDEQALDVWRQLAIRSYDRVVALAKAFRFPGGERLAPEDAADAAHEAFLRVVTMGERFNGSSVGELRAAIHRCVQYACLDHGRRALRHRKRQAGSLDERHDGAPDDGPFAAAIARESLERAELAADAEADEERRRAAAGLVAWAIGRIRNENYRAVLQLTFVERLDAAAIAERLGITLDNVYARRRRGLKQLETILRDQRA